MVSYFNFLILFLSSFLFISTAEANPCVQLNNLNAKTCGELAPVADLSACKDEERKKIRVRCRGSQAEVRVYGKRETYNFTLESQEGPWGSLVWNPKASSAEVRRPVANEEIRSPSSEKTKNREADVKSIEFSGYLDGYYAYNFNKNTQVSNISNTSSATAAMPLGNTSFRAYDVYQNQLALSLAELTIKGRLNDFSALLDLDFGPFADNNARQSDVVDEVSKHLGQAIVSYRAEGSRWSFDFGKMYTHLGLEVAKAKDNWQYSRSILYTYGLPFWHTGARVGYDIIPDTLTASTFLYNGWNSIYDNNNSKTLGFQLKATIANITAVYNLISGPERAQNERDDKTLHELNITWSGISNFSLAADFLTGSERRAVTDSIGRLNDAKWSGASLAAKWTFGRDNKFYISPRYEIFRDDSGYLLTSRISQTLKSTTLTLAHAPRQGIDLRVEYRHDKSNKKTFREGINKPEDDQSVISAAVLLTI
jgi:hypothetical protein